MVATVEPGLTTNLLEIVMISQLSNSSMQTPSLNASNLHPMIKNECGNPVGSAPVARDSRGGVSAPQDLQALEQGMQGLLQGFQKFMSVFIALMSKMQEFVVSQRQQVVGTSTQSSGGSGVSKFNPADMLWKPVASNGGKLAILMPKYVTGSVREVQLIGPDGKEIETGREIKAGAVESGRYNYRFKKAGGQYPSGVKVRVVFRDGATQEIVQKNPGARHGK